MATISRVLAVSASSICAAGKKIGFHDKYFKSGIYGQAAYEPVSVGVELEALTKNHKHRGPVAWGDCIPVSCSSNKESLPALTTDQILKTVHEIVAPALQGFMLTDFRSLAAKVDALSTKSSPDEVAAGDLARRVLHRFIPIDLDSGSQFQFNDKLHPTIRFGISQAILGVVALAGGVTMTEVICQEWGLAYPQHPIPIHARSDFNLHQKTEKMIAHRIASLHHGKVDDLVDQVGQDGSKLTHYLRSLSGRIADLGPDYYPTIHIDLNGALGEICELQAGRMLGQLFAWELASKPYRLRIERPVIMPTRQNQIDMMKTLHDYIRARKMLVEIVASEWISTLQDIHDWIKSGAVDVIRIKMHELGSIHNTIDAVLACKEKGVDVILSGNSETDLSGQISVHVALATQAGLMDLPGRAADSVLNFMQNEMARTFLIIENEPGVKDVS